MEAYKVKYQDTPRLRFVDLRRDGIDCIPVLGYSNNRNVEKTTRLHCHPGCLEFSLCLKGNLAFETPAKSFPFLPGSIFVCGPDELHHLRNNPCGLKVYSFLFKIPEGETPILGLNPCESKWIVQALTHLPNRLFTSSPTVLTFFQQLFSIYDSTSRQSPSRRIRMRVAALSLLLAIIDASKQPVRKASEKIEEIAQRIKNTPNEEYPIAALARECGVSASNFAAAFKKAKGLPLHAFLLDCRIARAQKLLLSTERTVTAIGQELRFYSAKHFANTFRRILGVTPRQYRHAHTQKSRPQNPVFLNNL